MEGNVYKEKWGTGEVTVTGDGLLIKQLTEAGLDSFYSGVGKVSYSDGATNTDTIVIAEYTHDGYEAYIKQTKFAEGNIQSRTGMSNGESTEWEEWENVVELSDYAKKAVTLAGYGITNAHTKDEVSTLLDALRNDIFNGAIYTHKGTIDHVSLLPTEDQKIGDSYSISREGTVSRTIKAVPIVFDYKEEETSFGGDSLWYNFDSVEYPLETGKIYDIYDENGNLLYCSAYSPGSAVPAVVYNDGRVNVEISYDDATNVLLNDPSDAVYIQVHGKEEDGIGENVTVETTVYAGGNVVWTGSYWDVFSGTVDTTGFARKYNTYTKTEVNNEFQAKGIPIINLTSSGTNLIEDVDWTPLNSINTKIAKVLISYLDYVGSSATAQGYVISVYGMGNYYNSIAQYMILGKEGSSHTFARRYYDEQYYSQEPGGWSGWVEVAGLAGAYKKSEVFTKLETASDTLSKIGSHNSNVESHPHILSYLATVEAIARGKSSAKVFDDVAEMESWLAVPENVEVLKIGDNLYIRDLDSPDFWWDGETAQQLEAKAINLSDYYTKEEVDLRTPEPIEQSDYDYLVANNLDIPGKIYYVVSDGELS